MQTSLFELKMNSTPQTFAQSLRNQGDIFWRELEKFWVITAYDHAKVILSSDDVTCDRSPFFMSSMPDLNPALIGDFFGVVSKMMVMSDAPEHTARRRICYDGFSNQTLDNLHPLIMKTIDKQITACLEKGEMDLVEDLAKIIPSTILADFFHIPENERHHFYEWSNNMTQFFGGTSHQGEAEAIKANEGAQSLRHYFTDLITQRRTKPSSDFLSILLKNQSAFHLSDDEIISQAIMMLVAGQITTTDQLCNNFYTLMTAPGAFAALQSGSVDIDAAMDELNRLDPAVTFIFRLAKKDMEIGGRSVQAGQAIFISSHAVNRDARVFEEPDHCNLQRKRNPHLSFAFGRHYCLGAKLAQLEMKNCVNELLKRLPHLRFKENALPKRKHHSLGFSGFETFPLQFDMP